MPSTLTLSTLLVQVPMLTGIYGIERVNKILFLIDLYPWFVLSLLPMFCFKSIITVYNLYLAMLGNILVCFLNRNSSQSQIWRMIQVQPMRCLDNSHVTWAGPITGSHHFLWLAAGHLPWGRSCCWSLLLGHLGYHLLDLKHNPQL